MHLPKNDFWDKCWYWLPCKWAKRVEKWNKAKCEPIISCVFLFNGLDITCYKTINLIQPLLIEQLLLCNLAWNGISFEDNAMLYRVESGMVTIFLNIIKDSVSKGNMSNRWMHQKHHEMPRSQLDIIKILYPIWNDLAS